MKTKAEMRDEWVAAGGSIHGPNVETVTMPEERYFEFREALAKELSESDAQLTSVRASMSRWYSVQAILDSVRTVARDFGLRDEHANGLPGDLAFIKSTIEGAERIKAKLHDDIRLLQSALPKQYHSMKDWYSWSTQSTMHAPLFKDLTNNHIAFLEADYAKALAAYATSIKQLQSDSGSWIGTRYVSMIEQRDTLQRQLDNVKPPSRVLSWQGRSLTMDDGWSEWRSIDSVDLRRWFSRVRRSPQHYELRPLAEAAFPLNWYGERDCPISPDGNHEWVQEPGALGSTCKHCLIVKETS